MARIAVLLLLSCLLAQDVTSISVNSALAGLNKLNQVKDMLGKIENAIGSLRGGKHFRTYNEDDDDAVVNEKKSDDDSETSDERQLVDDGDSVRSASTHADRHRQRETDAADDDQFSRQLKELVEVLRGTQHQCAAVDQPCVAGAQSCCRGLRCSTSGQCQLDCVDDGQSCRHNWFCCDGRRCNRRKDDFVCQ